jgi:PAS domain S-box-containing protein
VLAGLFAVDVATGEETTLVTLYLLAPLFASLGAGPRATAGAGALAIGLCTVAVLTAEETVAQDVVRVATVVSGSALAVWAAALRERLEALNAEVGDALGFLTEVYESAPVGIALLDTDLRFVRVNDRIAAINGLPAADHVGRRIGELLPGLPAEVEADVAAVARTGQRLDAVEVTGATPAKPGAKRHWMASYWPVRSPLSHAIVGVGIVVIEVTERRAAERAVRAQTDRYEALLLALSDVGEGMVVLDLDGRCTYANAAFEQLSGYTFPELAAMDTVLDLVVEYDRRDVRARVLSRVQAGGGVAPGQPLTLRRRDGALVARQLGGTPRPVADRRQLVVVVRDVTARRRAEAERERLLARSALLAEASELFDQSLDEDATMGQVARLCVREIADTCVILLGDEQTRVHRVAAVACEEERERELTAALQRAPLEDRDDDAILRVLAGAPGVVAPTPAGLGTPRSVIVPLRARGRLHGVLAAGFDDLPAREDDAALALFEDLGARAALALDNARLYQERDRIARTLQRALLPAELPDVPGVELAGRYVAAGTGNEVGGDFYDCFATGGGDWALVIGDVCGKGAEAAAMTGLARYTLRAAAQRTHSPRAVLGELNQALLRQQLDYRFCTVLYASLTPREGRATAVVASGGHPLPLLLRAGGTVETAGAPGTLLGILDTPEISEQTVELAPGDALVLFTDGVSEATEADRVRGPGRLAELLAGCAGAGAAAIAEAVERDALEVQGGHARDDVAVLVVRASDGPAGPFAAHGRGVAAAR